MCIHSVALKASVLFNAYMCVCMMYVHVSLAARSVASVLFGAAERVVCARRSAGVYVRICVFGACCMDSARQDFIVVLLRG